MKAPDKNEKEDHWSADAIMKGAVNDRELILCARQGDVDAFEQLVQKYDRRILSLAFSYTRNSEDAKDIYQETLIRAYKAIRKFEMRSEFSTWLYRIATNVCIRFRSSQRRYSEVFHRDTSPYHGDGDDIDRIDPPSSDSAENDFLRAELRRQIEQALGFLSPMQRLVFTLKHYEGYKVREIALITDCAEGTVKKYLYEAVRRLQKELEMVV